MIFTSYRHIGIVFLVVIALCLLQLLSYLRPSIVPPASPESHVNQPVLNQQHLKQEAIKQRSTPQMTQQMAQQEQTNHAADQGNKSKH